MLNLKKKNIDLLQKSALKLNSIINKYTDEKIKNMTRKDLMMLCYELMSYEYDTKKFKEYIIMDIKNHLYILEGQEISFKWVEEIPDYFYNLPTTIYKKLTQYETFMIVDYKIMCEKEKLCYEVNLYNLIPEKLDAFYDAFMEKVNKDSIFAKLKEVKEDLL